jgi:hypothetical protein
LHSPELKRQYGVDRGESIVNQLERAVEFSKVVQGIASVSPELVDRAALLPATSIEVARMSVKVLNDIGIVGRDGWIHILGPDIWCEDEEMPDDQLNEYLDCTLSGISVSPFTSDMWEIDWNEWDLDMKIIYSLFGQEFDPECFRDNREPRMIALAESLGGLLLERQPFPDFNLNSDPWRAVYFYDTGSGNRIVDQRTGFLEYPWADLATLKKDVLATDEFLKPVLHLNHLLFDENLDNFSEILRWCLELYHDLLCAQNKCKND